MRGRLSGKVFSLIFFFAMVGCTTDPVINPKPPTVTGDTAPPVVKITNPTNAEVVGKSFTVYGTANDPSEIDTVYVLVGGTVTNSTTNILNTSNWSIPVTVTSEGNIVLAAWAKDKKGNKSAPVSITVNSDWGTPSVVLVSPLNGILTNVTSIDVSGTASVYVDYNITSVLVKVNSDPYTPAVGTTAWTASGVTLISGTNTIQACVIADSNKTNYSAVIKVVVDTDGPVTVISSPTNNQPTGKTFVVYGTADDLSALDSVYLYVTGQPTNVVSSFYSVNHWSNAVVLTSEGNNTINAFSKDKWGNIGSPVSVTVFADWSFPAVSILYPGTGLATNVLSIKVSGSASIHPDFNIASVAVKVNGSGYIACTGTTSWSNLTVPLNNGSNNIMARAISDNNKTNFSAAVIVNVDKTPPVVTVTTKQDLNETGLKKFTIRGTISDASGGAMTTYLSLDGAAYMNASMVTTTWSKNYTNVSGSHTVFYYGVDKWGNVSVTNSTTVDVAKFKWNIMVYLDGDNNLEPYALVDFNEMEAWSGITNYQANIIVLIDRITGYSTADGNWVGTRLYRITRDPAGLNTTFISTRLAGMGLIATGDTDELNMGNGAVLAQFVDFVNNSYEADQSFIIFWDHGDGWRKPEAPSAPIAVSGSLKKGIIPKFTVWPNLSSKNKINIPDTKGVAYDESSANDYLLNAEVRVALTGKGIDVIGYDACLMGMMEAVYELKDVADIMIGSPDLEPGNGWQYNDWLTRFSTSYDATNLYKSVILSYSNQYAATATTTLAAYDLSKVNALFSALDTYTGQLLADTNTWVNPGRTNYAGNIQSQIEFSIEHYGLYASGNGINTDLWELADKLPKAGSAALKTAIQDAVLMEWHNATGTVMTGNPYSHGLSLYFGDFVGQSAPIGMTTHMFNGYYLIGTNGNFHATSLWNEYLKKHDAIPPYTWKGPGSYIYNQTKNVLQIYVTNAGTINSSLAVNASVDDDIYIFYQYLDWSMVVAYSYAGGTGQAETCNFTAPITGWYIILVDRYAGSAGLDSTLTFSQGTAMIY